MSLASSSPSIPTKEYDVFLSFRGTDTRKTFTDHLYHALERSGIVTFRDDPRLETGKAITPELLKAIQHSRCFVIILSENYASSGWCLEELAEIVKLKKEQEGLEVFPIFYHVDPFYFRRQKGKVGEAFAKHEGRCKEEDKHKIQKWRDALTQVSNINGDHLNDADHEGKFVGEFVKKISANLCQKYPIVHDGLVEISSRLKELYSKVQISKDDTRIIGISGMGGIGKSTLARVFYDRMSPDFEGKCFITDVRAASVKDGLVSLQKQLLFQLLNEEFKFFNVDDGKGVISRRLSSKKLLIVLDDVDKEHQLECLVGRRDWFGSGSKIIITTRDEHLLQPPRADDVYKPTTLNDDDALRLFNSKAFSNDTMPNNDFMELSKLVLRYAGGLPLALRVLGSFLRGRDAAQWTSAIERLERDPDEDIIKVLKISFDSLKKTEKDIFLDIACFFGDDEIDTKDFVMEIWDGCKFFPGIGIDDLVKKSLVTVEKDSHGKIRLKMHDLLREMGKKIVRDKSKEPGKRCRLWDGRDVCHVLTQNTATDAIECMLIPRDESLSFLKSVEASNLIVNAFSKMKNLRLLRVDASINCDHLNYLSNELRLFHWDRYPLRSFPPSFQPHNLVTLIARGSKIERLWEGTKRMDNLKRINLAFSGLIETPDFSEGPNLEYLSLDGCSRLVYVHPSIAEHKGVKFLYLKECTSLRSLPPEIRMESLEVLNLSDCDKIENWREVLRQAQLLSSLKELNLSYCNLGEGDIPAEIGCLSSLEILDLSSNYDFISIPCLTQLSKLYSVDLSRCTSLKALPELPTTITRVNINGCISLERIAIPSKACGNSFINCYRLAENMNAETLLKNHLKVFANSREGFDIIMTGSEIPEWFRGQGRVGSSSINIRLPLNIRNDSQWMGVAIFCIFIYREAWHKYKSPERLLFQAHVCHRNSRHVKFKVEDCWHKIGPIRTDHIFLRYLSHARLSASLESFSQEWDELEISFGQEYYFNFLVKVKQCGFRMVYQKDVEDIQLIEEQQYKNQGSAAEFEDNIEDGSIASGSLGKIKRNVSEDNTEAISQRPKCFKFIEWLKGRLQL